jgi:hypothetical protein
MTSNPKAQIFTLDRIENGIAILIPDHGTQIRMPIGSFSFPVEEGAVIRGALNADSDSWGSWHRDLNEERIRRKALLEKGARIQRSDPGGDISI